MSYHQQRRLAAATAGCLAAFIALAGCGAETPPVGTAGPDGSGPQASTQNAAAHTTTPQETASPTTYVSPTPKATLAPPDWVSIGRGISRVYLPVPTPNSSDPSYFYALRIDPKLVTFKVIYDDKMPHTVQEWGGIAKAAVVFNAAFFTGSNTPNGRIITDGVMYGEALDYGNDSIGVRGLFAVREHQAEIYALGRTDFNPQGMRFDQAVEAYPMLVLPGGQPTFPEDTFKRARRTVIGLDQDNQVIVVISDLPLYSLYELAQWAAVSNLGLDSALNFDGGRSTGILVSTQKEEKLINSYVPVPIVIAVYTQE